MRKTIGAVIVAVAVAGVGGAAISAATDGGPSMMDRGIPGAFGAPPPASSPRHAIDEPDTLHGEYVVANPAVGFTTKITQTGKVTAISTTSVSVRSDDGFVQTYGISGPGGLAGQFAVGDTATVEARREGEAAVLTTLRPPLSSGRLIGR